MHEHFQVLADDERFDSLEMSLRKQNLNRGFTYFIEVETAGEELAVIGALSHWASQRTLDAEFSDDRRSVIITE